MTAILKDALKSIIGPTLKSLFSWDSRLIDLKEIEYHLAGHNQLNERCLVDGYKCALVCLMCGGTCVTNMYNVAYLVANL